MGNSNSKKYSSLSKSRFINCLQCTKRLYLETYHRDVASPPTPSQQRIFDTGHMVGELACNRFPEGTLVEGDFRQPEKALAHTRELLHKEAPVLFEPAFLFDGIFVRVDILQQRTDGTWNIIEVKSTTKVNDTHIADAAVQTYVAENSGPTVAGTYIMHLNRSCRYPNLDNLFEIEEITEAALSLWPELRPKVAEFHHILSQDTPPDIPIGRHCLKPYECPFKSHCRQHVKEPSVFSVPRISAQKIEKLTSKGIYSIYNIPEDFPLSANQRRYVGLFDHNIPQILWPAILDELNTLSYPLYFLDFETQMDAVPRLEGLRPIYIDTEDVGKVCTLAGSVFWLVLPSLSLY